MHKICTSYQQREIVARFAQRAYVVTKLKSKKGNAIAQCGESLPENRARYYAVTIRNTYLTLSSPHLSLFL